MAIIIRRDRRNPLQGDVIVTRKATPDIWQKIRQRARERYQNVRVGMTDGDVVFMNAGHWRFFFCTSPQEAEKIYWG